MKLIRLLAIAGIVVLVPLIAFSVYRVWSRAAPERSIPPTIVVEASYPGANAQVVADTIAAPIEQQVNGVEGMLNLHSHCSNEGKYLLVVAFTPGTVSIPRKS